MNFRFSHVCFSLTASVILWTAVAVAQQQQPYYGTQPAGARQPAAQPTTQPYQPAPAYPNTTAPAYPNTGAPTYTPQPTTAPPVAPTTAPPTAQPTTQPGVHQVQVRQAPFQLTAEQQREVDLILAHWEKFSLAVNHFQTGFHRFRTVTAFDDANKMEKTTETGELRYQSPDCGMFAVVDAKGTPIEKWLCDGASVYEYQYTQKKIQQHLLPENMRGKGITQGPLPFLFGASAATLKQRYFIRRTTPSEKFRVDGQVWLEVFPRTVDDAQDFQRAEMIIALKPEVRPVAIGLFKANSETHSYVFDQKNMKINARQLIAPSWKPTNAEIREMRLEQDTGQ